MDNIKVGIYLQALRKTKGITQSELADILNVSSKTVSKWECGISLPEIPMLKILSEYYNVLVDDILNGGKIEKGNIKEISEKTKEANYEYFYQRDLHKFKIWRMLSFLFLGISIFGTICWTLIACAVGGTDIFIMPVAFLAFSIFVSIILFFLCIYMNENKKINDKYAKLFASKRRKYKIIFLLSVFIWLVFALVILFLLSSWAFYNY